MRQDSHNGSLRGTLIATILGSSLAFLDASIVNVILPKIKTEFGLDVTQVQWVIHAYGLFLSTFLLLGGALGDHFGRKRLFQIGLVIFVLSSVACGMASSFWMLLLARSVQGFGAALLTPESLAILEASFSKNQRPRAIGIWSSFSATAGAVGPPLGGLLSDTLGWRSAFLINLPIGALAWLVARRSIPEVCDETASASLDLWGTVLSTLGVAGIICGLTRTPAFGIAGLIFLSLFLCVEHWSKNPLLPLSVFRSRAFSFCNAMTLFLYGALGATFFFLPIHWITTEGYSSAQAGLAVLPSILSIFALSPVSGSLVPKLGARAMLTVGSLVVGAGYFTLSQTSASGWYWSAYFPGLLIIGIGMAIVITPLTVTVLSSLGEQRSGLASGFNNAVARLAGLIGVACASLAMSALPASTGHRVFLLNSVCAVVAAGFGLFSVQKSV